MASVWISRAIAAGVILSGPALALYASGDVGRWSHWAEQLLLGTPLAFFAAAAFSYVIASGFTRHKLNRTRTFVAAVGGLITPLATAALAWPLILALAMSGACAIPDVSIAFSILAVPTAAFVTVLMPYQKGRWLDFLAHISVPGTALALTVWFATHRACGVLPEAPARLFETWPALFALSPYIALAVAGAESAPVRRLALAVALTLIPLYGAKAGTDFYRGEGLQALVWPMRVWRDFIGSSERVALALERKGIRPDASMHIGKHRYRFDGVKILNSDSGKARRPDQINFLQLSVPIDKIDLRAESITGEPILLSISTFPQSIAEFERGGWIATHDEDLTIYVPAQKHGTFDRETIRGKVQSYIRKSRVAPSD